MERYIYKITDGTLPVYVHRAYTVTNSEYTLVEEHEGMTTDQADARCAELEQGEFREPPKADPVNHPPHYTGPLQDLGIEVIQVTELSDFNLGNALKYIFRADWKGNRKQDLEKAVWYLNRALARGSQND